MNQRRGRRKALAKGNLAETADRRGEASPVSLLLCRTPQCLPLAESRKNPSGEGDVWLSEPQAQHQKQSKESGGSRGCLLLRRGPPGSRDLSPRSEASQSFV